jgi:2-oxoisovalerate dehydrogenase E1 component
VGRAEALDAHCRDAVGRLRPVRSRPDPAQAVRDGSRLDGRTALDAYAAQLESRHLDLAARWLQQQGRGYYTIGSAGHEANAAVALALRPTDPALLHYRSAAFYCARAHQLPDVDPVRDVLLGVVAAADAPIAGGRH